MAAAITGNETLSELLSDGSGGENDSLGPLSLLHTLKTVIVGESENVESHSKVGVAVRLQRLVRRLRMMGDASLVHSWDAKVWQSHVIGLYGELERKLGHVVADVLLATAAVGEKQAPCQAVNADAASSAAAAAAEQVAAAEQAAADAAAAEAAPADAVAAKKAIAAAAAASLPSQDLPTLNVSRAEQAAVESEMQDLDCGDREAHFEALASGGVPFLPHANSSSHLFERCVLPPFHCRYCCYISVALTAILPASCVLPNATGSLRQRIVKTLASKISKRLCICGHARAEH